MLETSNDEFILNVIVLPERIRLTKLTLLSDLNKVFDILDFLAPVLIMGMKTDWDTSIAEDIQTK